MEESLNFQILCEYSGFDESFTSETFFILTFCVPFYVFDLTQYRFIFTRLVTAANSGNILSSVPFQSNHNTINQSELQLHCFVVRRCITSAKTAGSVHQSYSQGLPRGSAPRSSVAERLERWTCHSEAPSSSLASWICSRQSRVQILDHICKIANWFVFNQLGFLTMLPSI